MELQVRTTGGWLERVDDTNPFPVRLPDLNGSGLPAVAGRTAWVMQEIPGVGTGAAYADKDQLGTLMAFAGLVRPEKRSGLLHTALYFDVDDEGLQVDLHLFSRSIAPSSVDNGALVIPDADMLAWIGTVQFTSFFDFNTSQVSQVANVGLALSLQSTTLYAIAQARGALNVAAANIPKLALAVLPD